MVRRSLGNFNILNKTLSAVGVELCGIKFDLESERPFDADNFDWLSVVDFSHPFNLDEFDVIPLLERMTFIFVNSNGCLFLISN